jgi:ElaB/YqjD/DUF883 family membrane-anchored ribosome-binding protein
MATEIPTTNQPREIKEIVDSARDKAMHFKDVALDRGRDAVTAIERVIEERPLAVLGGVFAGGILLGMLLRR